MTGHREKDDKKLVEKHFAPRLRCVPYPTASGRTPDFKLYSGDDHVGVCEIKSPQPRGKDDELGSCYRLTDLTLKAVEQFNAVNSDGSLLNVLVFVSHDPHADAAHLLKTIGGVRVTPDGEFGIPAYVRTASKLNPARQCIDAIMWFGASASGELAESLLNRTLGEDRLRRTCNFVFGLDPPIKAV
jgi:hypothetical protein